MDLNKLLKPRNICIVGASDKEGFGGDTARNAIRYMDAGSYFFVNPKRDEVMGHKCWPSIDALSQDIDCVVICTPASTVEDLLRQAHAKGAGAAVIYASGYKEMGTPEGEAAQASLAALCKELDMALMGPNCAGFINYVDDVHAFAFIPQQRDRRGGVGFASQSGQLCYSMMESPASTFSYAISAGNAAVTTMEDYIEFLINDADTKVVAVYLEGIQDAARFAGCLRKAAQKRKPVVVLKTGRSEKGERVAASHTGSLAGADRIFDALFKKFGVIRVDDLEELIYTAQLFATLPRLPRGTGVGSMNLSGGETGICADVGSLYGIDYPDFSPSTMDALAAMLPVYASPANPLDMTATLSYDTEKYAAALRCVMRDPGVDLVLVGYTLTQEITDPAIHYMAAAMELVGKDADAKPMVMLPFTGNTRNAEYQKKLADSGVCILPPPTYGFRILRYLFDFICYDYAGVDPTLAIPKRARTSQRFSITEHAGKMAVGRYGVPVPQEDIATSEQHALDIAARVGFPIVMKISSPDILHKSDIGGVVLDIETMAGVRESYARILTNARAAQPNAYIEGVLVQHMADWGTEILIGVSSDPQLGPAIMAGFGGVYVEVFKDTALRLAPISKEEAHGMIASLKASRLLTGYRGKPPLDIEALADAMVCVSHMAADMKDTLVELDINPIFVYEKGVCAVDAVIVRDTPMEAPDEPYAE